MTTDEIRQAQDMTRANEGLRLKPYLDTVGKTTIGYGRNLSGRGITELEAAHLFGTDWWEAHESLRSLSWFSVLNGPRQAAVIDMRFNLGAVGFSEFTYFIDAMVAKAYKVAAEQMRDSAWYNQVKGRAERDAKMVETGEWQ
jgi:lysozyme